MRLLFEQEKNFVVKMVAIFVLVKMQQLLLKIKNQLALVFLDLLLVNYEHKGYAKIISLAPEVL